MLLLAQVYSVCCCVVDNLYLHNPLMTSDEQAGSVLPGLTLWTEHTLTKKVKAVVRKDCLEV